MGLKILLDRVGGEGRVERCVGGLVAHDDGLAVLARARPGRGNGEEIDIARAQAAQIDRSSK